MPPLVAIIMRSKNEIPHLRAALDMLKRQTFQDYELFAVDSGSTDGSLEALRVSCDDTHLTQINPDDYVPGPVLNTAISRTVHPIVVLLNADAVPCSEDWLEKLIQPLLDQTADATFSRQIARPDAYFIVAYDYERAYDSAKLDTPFFSAVACAFKRELWERNPFRETGYAEDADWANACRADHARIRLAGESVVEHSHNYSLKELFRKRRRQARTFGSPPRLGRQLALCAREMVRDTLHAMETLKLQTLPYNLAYRITIHAGLHRGLKEGATAGLTADG